MSRKNTAPLPGQEILFEVTPAVSYDPKSPDWPAVHHTYLAPVIHPEDYPSVLLADRRQHLQLALGALGKASQRMGFGRALSTPFRTGIAARYGEKTDYVAAGAERKVNELEDKAVEHLRSAMGVTAMKHAGVEFDTAPHEKRFLEKFASPEKRFARKKLEDQLKTQDKRTRGQ